MMSIQVIWKRLMTNEVPLSFHRLYLASSMLPPLAFYAKSHKNFANFCTDIANFCTDIAVPSTTLHRGIATEFLINKCGLTGAEITKAFRHCNRLKSSSQNLEEVLELLSGCGLTAPDQIRKVVLGNPMFLFYKSRNIKSKLSFFRTFMKEEDIAKLVCYGSSTFCSSEGRYKSTILLLQKLGIEGEALSHLLARQPRLLTTPDEKVVESFKQAEDLGFKKGSRMFAVALRAILGLGQGNIDKKRQCLSTLGFVENQISDLWRKMPRSLGLTEEKMKRNVEFVFKTAGFSCADVVKYPHLLAYSVETRMIPRYRVMEALKSMQVQVPKKKRFSPSIFVLTEKRFLERYVSSNAESSSLLLDIYNGKMESWKSDL